MANPAQMKFILQKRDREKRKRLILLVRILTTLLDRTNRFMLLHKVKCVVREYTIRCQRRRAGGGVGVAVSSEYRDSTPLHDAIEARLRALIDDKTWTSVILCLELYMSHRHNRKQPPAPPTIVTPVTRPPTIVTPVTPVTTRPTAPTIIAPSLRIQQPPMMFSSTKRRTSIPTGGSGQVPI